MASAKKKVAAKAPAKKPAKAKGKKGGGRKAPAPEKRANLNLMEGEDEVWQRRSNYALGAAPTADETLRAHRKARLYWPSGEARSEREVLEWEAAFLRWQLIVADTRWTQTWEKLMSRPVVMGLRLLRARLVEAQKTGPLSDDRQEELFQAELLLARAGQAEELGALIDPTTTPVLPSAKETEDKLVDRVRSLAGDLGYMVLLHEQTQHRVKGISRLVQTLPDATPKKHTILGALAETLADLERGARRVLDELPDVDVTAAQEGMSRTLRTQFDPRLKAFRLDPLNTALTDDDADKEPS